MLLSMLKAHETSLIGAAGVHYAAYKLTLRGMLALPTVRNTPGTDLIVTSLYGRNHANIQVKTSQHARAKFWIICNAKKFANLPFGEHDFYVFLRPRRTDDPIQAPMDEFEGYMLTAAEAKDEMAAQLKYWTAKGQDPKFSLCIYVDKGPREKLWGLPENSKQIWRERWQTWTLVE
jgi:hypothetical protein